jgi:hypothetical protein
MPKEIKDFDEAVLVLGGTMQAARMIGRRPPQIAQWRKRYGAFPAELYLVIDRVLRDRGFSAAPSLFRFERPRSPRSRTAA